MKGHAPSVINMSAVNGYQKKILQAPAAFSRRSLAGPGALAVEKVVVGGWEGGGGGTGTNESGSQNETVFAMKKITGPENVHRRGGAAVMKTNPGQTRGQGSSFFAAQKGQYPLIWTGCGCRPTLPYHCHGRPCRHNTRRPCAAVLRNLAEAGACTGDTCDRHPPTYIRKIFSGEKRNLAEGSEIGGSL